jgi:hypothetical protein
MIHKSLTMLVLMIGLRKKGSKRHVGPRRYTSGDITSYEGFHALTATGKRSHARVNWRRWFRLINGSALWARSASNHRNRAYSTITPSSGFFAWMDSPEGERAQELLDALLDLMEDVQVDPKQRKIVWPDAGSLDLPQSIEHIQRECPDFSVEEIERHLWYWIESGYGPDNCSQEQLEELERLSPQWVADYTRRAA